MKLLLTFLLAITLISCRKEDVSPIGSVKITISNTGASASVFGNYTLYTEVGYQRDLVLRNGLMTYVSAGTYEVVLDDLNPGNYVVAMRIGTYTSSRAVQVTGGRQRDYTN